MTERFIHRRIAELTENVDSTLALCLLLFRGVSEKEVHIVGQEISDISYQSSAEETANRTPYEVTGGISKSKDAIGYGYPMVDTTMVIKNRFIPDAFTQYIEADIDEQYRFCILEGDVILNRTSETISSLACCCVADRDHDAVYSGYTKRLRPINREILDPSYMAGFFSSEIYRKQIVDLSPVFTTRASINNDTLSKIHVYYPNKEMQEKLGSILYGIHEIMILEEQVEARSRLQRIWDILVEQFITLPIMEQMREGE